MRELVCIFVYIFRRVFELNPPPPARRSKVYVWQHYMQKCIVNIALSTLETSSLQICKILPGLFIMTRKYFWLIEISYVDTLNIGFREMSQKYNAPLGSLPLFNTAHVAKQHICYSIRKKQLASRLIIHFNTRLGQLCPETSEY